MTKMSNVISIALITLLLLPSLGAIVPADAENSTVEEEGWWVDTTVDRNKNGIGDMIERHIDNPILLKEGTLPIIVDFDTLPTLKMFKCFQNLLIMSMNGTSQVSMR